MAYDFPDFLSTKQASNTTARVFDQTVTANTTIPAIDLTQFSEVIISGNNEDAGAIMELQIGFIASVVDPLPNPVKSIVFGPGQSGSIRVPALREQLQIIVVPHGPVATQHMQVSEYGMAQHVNMYDLYTGVPLLLSYSHAFAIGGTSTVPIVPWYSGQVQITALADSADPCLVVFDYYDAALAAYVEFAQIGTLGQYLNQPQVLTFPPNPIRCRFFNGSTAQTVEMYISPSASNGI